VDKGTEDEVVNVVRNLVYHLKKGYMIVKCRGQQDIQEQMSLTQALQNERSFFEDHPHFRCAVPTVPNQGPRFLCVPIAGQSRHQGCVYVCVLV
jgi:hypothetical protein